jgi:ribosomal protein L32E
VLEMKKKFLNLMDKMKAHENDKFFRLTRWDRFYKLDEPVWRMSDNSLVKLVN